MLPPADRKGKNLEMHEVENPAMKETTATMITEFLFIGDEETAYDPTFMKQNQVTHILNTKPDQIANLFDPNSHKDAVFKLKIKMYPNVIQRFTGTVLY
jgi:hypothetical protein